MTSYFIPSTDGLLIYLTFKSVSELGILLRWKEWAHVSCQRKLQVHVKSLLLPASHSSKHKPQYAEVSHCFIWRAYLYLSPSWLVSAFDYYWKSLKILGTNHESFTALNFSKSRLREGAHVVIQCDVPFTCFPCKVIRAWCFFTQTRRRLWGEGLSLVLGFSFLLHLYGT